MLARRLLRATASFRNTVSARAFRTRRRPADSPQVWRYTPNPDGRAAELACCGGAIGGPAVDGSLVILATVDGHVTTLNAADGRVVWDAQVADPGQGETLREAPLVADGKVFVGKRRR